MGLKVSNIILMDHEPWVACPWYFWDFGIGKLWGKTLGWNHCNSNIVDISGALFTLETQEGARDVNNNWPTIII